MKRTTSFTVPRHLRTRFNFFASINDISGEAYLRERMLDFISGHQLPMQPPIRLKGNDPVNLSVRVDASLHKACCSACKACGIRLGELLRAFVLEATQMTGELGNKKGETDAC